MLATSAIEGIASLQHIISKHFQSLIDWITCRSLAHVQIVFKSPRRTEPNAYLYEELRAGIRRTNQRQG